MVCVALWPLAQEALALLDQLFANVCAQPLVCLLPRLQLESYFSEPAELGDRLRLGNN